LEGATSVVVGEEGLGEPFQKLASRKETAKHGMRGRGTFTKEGVSIGGKEMKRENSISKRCPHTPIRE